MQTQFWVIGGSYQDHSFTNVIEGTLDVAGPFADRAEAARIWSERAQASRYQATTRYTIVASPGPAEMIGK